MNIIITNSYFFTFIFLNISILFFYFISKKINLIDKPTERKMHKGEIPLIGGLSIFSTLVFFIYIFSIPYHLNIVIISSCLILIIGVYDDMFQTTVIIRIFFQLIASMIIIFSGLYIINLGNYLYIGDINLELFGIILTIIFVLGLTNSINFIDGLDGLAAGIILVGLISLFSYSYFINIIPDKDLFIFLISSLIIFLFFNLGFFKNKKIFLGDAGSTTLGFILGWLLIYYSLPNNHNIDPALTIWCVTIPVFDLLSLLIIRISNKKNPLRPDHNHIHHTLIKMQLNPKLVLFIIIILSIFFSILGFIFFYYFGSTVSIIMYIVFFIIYLNIRIKFLKRLLYNEN